MEDNRPFQSQSSQKQLRSPTPQEGLRLHRAFWKIAREEDREKLMRYAEELAEIDPQKD